LTKPGPDYNRYMRTKEIFFEIQVKLEDNWTITKISEWVQTTYGVSDDKAREWIDCVYDMIY
jgi:hypothetical protein